MNIVLLYYLYMAFIVDILLLLDNNAIFVITLLRNPSANDIINTYEMAGLNLLIKQQSYHINVNKLKYRITTI